mmetsp:Transcript_1822/g.7965  ORF Transcript_1822/g.7965 Transcript_1822/m.7965 type:complete len:81 (-) Transcript_1822:160-402(-)
MVNGARLSRLSEFGRALVVLQDLVWEILGPQTTMKILEDRVQPGASLKNESALMMTVVSIVLIRAAFEVASRVADMQKAS